MKLIVCGKGGTGKTVISILLARAFRALGYVPYILDMDESNETLPVLAGAEKPRPLLDLYGGRRGLAQMLKQGEGTILQALQQIATSELYLSSIQYPYRTVTEDGINILVIGKIRELGEGCACPLNVLSRLIIQKMKLRDNEVLIVDTDAGVEHVGRGVEEVTDGIIAVSDLTYESLVLSKHLKQIANKIGKSYWLVLNKVPEEFRKTIIELCKKLDIEPSCIVPFDKAIFEACMLGSCIRSEVAYNVLKDFVEKKILQKS